MVIGIDEGMLTGRGVVPEIYEILLLKRERVIEL